VLEVAGIPGFLENLEEMMESSDSEGAAWNAFIGAWRDRYDTAAVTAAELCDLALFRDPPPPSSGANAQARRTSFGMAIGRMRDRVFRLGDLRVRLAKAGTCRRAVKWPLRWLERDDARIVWLRANRTPWKKIGREIGPSRPAANRHWQYGIALITWRLHGRVPSAKRSQRFVIENADRLSRKIIL
jgi:hypothetical protein